MCGVTKYPVANVMTSDEPKPPNGSNLKKKLVNATAVVAGIAGGAFAVHKAHKIHQTNLRKHITVKLTGHDALQQFVLNLGERLRCPGDKMSAIRREKSFVPASPAATAESSSAENKATLLGTAAAVALWRRTMGEGGREGEGEGGREGEGEGGGGGQQQLEFNNDEATGPLYSNIFTAESFFKRFDGHKPPDTIYIDFNTALVSQGEASTSATSGENDKETSPYVVDLQRYIGRMNRILVLCMDTYAKTFMVLSAVDGNNVDVGATAAPVAPVLGAAGEVAKSSEMVNVSLAASPSITLNGNGQAAQLSGQAAQSRRLAGDNASSEAQMLAVAPSVAKVESTDPPSTWKELAAASAAVSAAKMSSHGDPGGSSAGAAS